MQQCNNATPQCTSRIYKLHCDDVWRDVNLSQSGSDFFSDKFVSEWVRFLDFRYCPKLIIIKTITLAISCCGLYMY